MSALIDRRRLIGGIGAGAGGMLLAGCDKLYSQPTFQKMLRDAEGLHYRSQRLISGGQSLAREYGAADRSPVFRSNGTAMPMTSEYQTHLKAKFADWRLIVDGLVTRPLAISLPQLMTLPVRTQITRHDCVEGWSAIGKWAGPNLSTILQQAGLSSRARFIVFHCADMIGGHPYYESIDLVDAFHPQTIMAWRLNDIMLPVANGAPVRLRVERQLGYKHAKYVMRIEARDTLAGLYGGKGGLWEDQTGYAWYAGI
ncbi:MAG: molybdopterin-dependent oxidoreductase [Sphingomonas sp.]|uniref:molybdopterin-dependent oxidoreductase n=1 Tax=Sphingomonas sp. TaxID=28214 RepID=UPI001804EBCE|nr:molybdopterin-dependent oxidoreductase [Sphingomonas sp.]MBA3666710.1 molybdopterin-dependent oxidoreductase [Sphingomonas sp.]